MDTIFNIIIVVTTASLPWIIDRVDPKSKRKNSNLFLLTWLAAILFPLSQIIPNIHISTETTTFQQHFVGGGFYCALLYTYLKIRFNWWHYWLIDLAFMYAFVSALGVGNELLEFFLVKWAHVTSIDITDTSWDLTANTVGGLVGYGLIRLIARIRNMKMSRKLHA